MAFRLFVLAAAASVVLGCNRGETPPAATQADTASTAAPQAAQTPPADPAEQAADATASPPDAKLLEQAMSAAQNGDFDEAVGLAEQAVQADPNDTEALQFLAVATFQKGQSSKDQQAANTMFLKTASAVRALRERQQQVPPILLRIADQLFFVAARAYASAGENEKALTALQDAVELGYEDLQQVQSDSDLAALRETPEFQSWFAQAVQEIQQRIAEEVRAELAAQQPFPFSFALPDLAGNTVSLEDFKGQVVIADIWGTWCPPCRMEIPHFVQLYDKFHGSGLAIVGLNYERVPEEEVVATIQSFVEENGMPYPCLIGDRETQSQIPEFQGFPTTLFIDATGTVRLKLVGYHPYAKLEAIVQQLLAESQPPPQS